eukprot:TRINITY_DN2243_c1_g1_i3.p3 TRINITY_DN2243_c1_g1~~TRINITY_DN2243_c1_g1_i3.p3  ORF type:complete len:129 (+),score=31.27 TRINITY_DN2243_c1_g1_i3:987-1373(+)
MCLLAAAHPHLYLDPDNRAYIIPPEKMKFDLRGRLDVASKGDFAYIDVGEVGFALAYTRQSNCSACSSSSSSSSILAPAPAAPPPPAAAAAALCGRHHVSGDGRSTASQQNASDTASAALCAKPQVPC